MQKAIRLAAALIAVSTLPACATVVRGTKTSYKITSSPEAAEIVLSTGQKCVTPCKLKLKRRDGFTATASKPGYQSATAEVESKISAGGGVAAAGNVLLGGIVGGVVDGTNGSLNSFFPSALQFKLEPVTGAAPAVTGGNE